MSVEEILGQVDVCMADYVGGGGYNANLTLDAFIAALEVVFIGGVSCG
jgi:hypothetical protein